jgi:hypothetical protein
VSVELRWTPATPPQQPLRAAPPEEIHHKQLDTAGTGPALRKKWNQNLSQAGQVCEEGKRKNVLTFEKSLAPSEQRTPRRGRGGEAESSSWQPVGRRRRAGPDAAARSPPAAAASPLLWFLHGSAPGPHTGARAETGAASESTGEAQPPEPFRRIRVIQDARPAARSASRASRTEVREWVGGADCGGDARWVGGDGAAWVWFGLVWFGVSGRKTATIHFFREEEESRRLTALGTGSPITVQYIVLADRLVLVIGLEVRERFRSSTNYSL